MSDRRRLRIATYNVHSCLGTDGRHDLERIGAVIRSLDVDVVALQEVESPTGRPDDDDQLSALTRLTGFALGIEGPTRPCRRGPFGNAILTRWPVVAVRRIDLSIPDREARGALDVDLDVGGVLVRVVATHFGLRSHERAAQWTRLLAHWNTRATPAVLLGDFNHWWWRDHVLAAVERQLGATPALRTFPSRRPVLALDRLWSQPASALRSIHVVSTALTRIASDHLPLRAELTFEASVAPAAP
jgi:endonuclease/exonuclease/phosphatase family metal-dependent hydrolase